MANVKRDESPNRVKDLEIIEGPENRKGMEGKGSAEKAKQAKRKESIGSKAESECKRKARIR